MTLLSHASMPKTYWTYAFSTATYLINRLPTPTIIMDSPYHKLFGSQPNYTKLKVYGCLCFPWLRPYTNHKLQDRSTPCVFLGYSTTQSAYLCLQPTTGRIYVSRHVRFDETSFPFSKPATTIPASPSPPETQAPTTSPPVTKIPFTVPLTTQPLTGSLSSDSHLEEQQDSPTLSNTPTSTSNSTTASTNSSSAAVPSSTQQPQPPDSSSTEELAPQPQQPPVVHPMLTRRRNNIHRPNPKYTYSAALSSSIPAEPNTLLQALKDKRWRGSMSTEIDAFARNGTYSLVPRHPDQNVIGCKWLYKNKFHSNGSHKLCKSRLVAKGYTQRHGQDYTDTFSPVIKATTLRLVLDIAVSNSWPLQQLDVNNAFMQGTLTEEVYMTQPPGFEDPDRPDHVCRLHKAIYGLKRAPRAWYTELSSFLLNLGFTNSLAGTSLFVFKRASEVIYLLIYVDDILVTGNTTSGIQRILQLLADRFSVKDPEDFHYFLGLEARRTPTGLHLSQRKYILDLLHRYDMTNAKPVTTPMATTPKLTLTSGTKLSDPSKYRQLLGSLQYLQFTRLDIAFAVNRLSQFMHQPTEDHWQAAKRILQYLAGTVTHGIYFSKNNKLLLHAYSDADWAGDSDDYVSTNSYIVYLGKHPISWTAKKHNGVARSSTEAEYRAVANTAAELTWICNILTELGISIPCPPVVFCDNVGATFLCANPVFHSRMKQIAIDYHFVRGQVQRGALRVTHVNTRDQYADALTKPLSRARFLKLRDKIGVTCAPPS